MSAFKVLKDADYGYIVADASVRSFSFAMVPATGFAFESQKDASIRAAELAGKEVSLRMIETPDRFEEVADTRYGKAW